MYQVHLTSLWWSDKVNTYRNNVGTGIVCILSITADDYKKMLKWYFVRIDPPNQLFRTSSFSGSCRFLSAINQPVNLFMSERPELSSGFDHRRPRVDGIGCEMEFARRVPREIRVIGTSLQTYTRYSCTFIMKTIIGNKSLMENLFFIYLLYTITLTADWLAVG